MTESKKCRMCLLVKPETDFVVRGKSKITNTCEDCSLTRRKKDYCVHNKREHDCYECGDPIIRRTTSIIHSSRIADKKKSRMCDLDFTSVLNKIVDTPNCVYCGIEFQYIAPYLPNFATIDRINDNIGHTNDNTLIACRSCNCSHNKHKYILKPL